MRMYFIFTPFQPFHNEQTRCAIQKHASVVDSKVSEIEISLNLVYLICDSVCLSYIIISTSSTNDIIFLTLLIYFSVNPAMIDIRKFSGILTRALAFIEPRM